MSQIERRYIVEKLRFRPGFPSIQGEVIRQGYWDSPEHDILRVRITDGHDGLRAEISRKLGMGIVRSTSTKPVDVDTGLWLYRNCPYRVEKFRYVLDGWKIDQFTLPGELIVIERPVASVDEPVVIPTWAVGAAEVTDTVNNLHIAKLASADPDDAFPSDRLTKRIPRIVLTGGPCSGKSTVMRAAIKRFGHTLHCVPETATIVISLVGAKPPGSRPEYLRFQQGIYRIQCEFEALSGQQALSDGKRALLMDRGTLGNAAYLEGGTSRMAEVCRTDPETELRRYASVIVLDVPPKDVYEANASNNDARSETWEEARALGDRILQAWGGHGDLHVIRDCGSMDEKIERALALIAGTPA